MKIDETESKTINLEEFAKKIDQVNALLIEREERERIINRLLETCEMYKKGSEELLKIINKFTGSNLSIMGFEK